MWLLSGWVEVGCGFGKVIWRKEPSLALRIGVGLVFWRDSRCCGATFGWDAGFAFKFRRHTAFFTRSDEGYIG
jgi:hypothetical protein